MDETIKNSEIFYPETIDDNPFPTEEGEVSFDSSQKTSNDEYQSKTIKNQPYPYRKIAYEVIGTALNTKSKRILAEFKFTESGAIQIGKYENGTSGDIRITPNGIVARNEAGTTTFSLDGTTGDAVFKGTIQADTFIAGAVQVGGDNMILDGENTQFLLFDENGNCAVFIGYLKDSF